MKRRWISSPRASSANWALTTAPCTPSVISMNRTGRWNAITGTPARAQPATTVGGTSRHVDPSSTAKAAIPCPTSDAVQAAGSAFAPSPVVSTSSPPFNRSSGSGISITCAQRMSRSRAVCPITTSGNARRTTGRSSTSARLSMTMCHP